MPQATATPAPSAPVVSSPPIQAEPGGRLITARLPNGQELAVQVPRSDLELRGLRTRRELLAGQLREATERRSELTVQLAREGSQVAREGIQKQLATLDESIVRLELDRDITEQAITSTPPELLANTSTRVPDEGDPPGMIHEDEAALIAFVTFGVGCMIASFVGRFRRQRALRKAGVRPGAELGAPDPRIERLVQAVDAMAVEVERIGEGQRFVTQVLAQRPQGEPALRGGDDLRR